MSQVASTSLEDIRAELSRVTEFKKLLEQEAGFPLDGIHPIRESIQKSSIEGTVLQSRELAEILSTLRAARIARQFVSNRRETYPELWKIAEQLFPDKVLEYNLDQAVDETGLVRANASRELQSIRRAIADKYEQLKKRLESILKNVSEQGFTQDELITTREGRMVIPVKSEHKNRVHGFIHSASASGATVFIEPTETLELNNEIRSLQFQEQREIERILRALTKQIGESREPLIANTLQLAQLDGLNAKAKYSIEILGVEPEVNRSGMLRLVQARHPILLSTHGRDTTVPLNIELGDRYNTLIISGPNAGGKSVAMKAVGLLCLMVQHGLHIPASEDSVLRVFERFFVDIGDEQSIENDLSTFSSHLKNLKEIEALADSDSLVLIDEIGAGTDPAEGGAIAAALLESLTKRGSFTIATTHHSSLKVFAHNTDHVENGAMEFDQAGLTPTYKFKAGIPGSSYAFEMAQRLGINKVILQRSREFIGVQQAKLEQLITQLEASTQKYMTELETAIAERLTLEDLIRKYELKISSQAAELKELKRKAILEAQEIVENANAVIERSIREIKERSADSGTVKQARSDVKKVQEELAKRREELPKGQIEYDVGELEVGATVRFSGGLQTGQIVSITPDGRSALVLFGSLKMKAALRDLEPAKKNSLDFRPASAITVSEKPTAVLRDIDLRGMTSDEALPLVDKFIDTAMLSGLHRVDIIHGKGTGALRRKVSEFLSKHPRVKSFRIAEWNEGGMGATVVELTEN